MKKVILLTLVLGFSMPLMAQKAKKIKQTKPETVAIAYHKAMAELDFETVKSISTPEAQQITSLLESLLKEVPQAEIEEARKKAKVENKKLKSSTCKIDGELATCTVCCPETEEGAEPEPLLLKKVNGKWFVHIEKGPEFDDDGALPGLLPEED